MVGSGDHVETFVELIRRASTQLPPDVERALVEGRQAESDGSLAESALWDDPGQRESRPRAVCADLPGHRNPGRGGLHHPVGFSTRDLEDQFVEAVRQATDRRYLRPNAVDTLTGKNTGSGTGLGSRSSTSRSGMPTGSRFG